METTTIPWPKVPSNLLRLSVIFQDLSRQVAGVITDGFEVGGFAPGTYFYHCTNGSCANIAEFSIENATCPLSLPDGSAEDVQGRAINFHSLPFFCLTTWRCSRKQARSAQGWLGSRTSSLIFDREYTCNPAVVLSQGSFGRLFDDRLFLTDCF